jgi:hypothetical protein
MYYERYRRKRASGFVQPAAYRCSGRQRSERCSNPMHIHADYVEEHVEELFRSRVDPSRMPGKGRIRVLGGRRDAQHAQRRLASLKRRRKELVRALDKLAEERYAKGTLQAAEHTHQRDRFLVERAEVDADIERLETLATSSEPSRELAWWDVWDDNMTVQHKHQAFRLVMGRILVLPSPKKGRGQRELVPKRLRIDWLA